MKQRINALITELKQENKERSTAINDVECSDYTRTALIHTYNSTLDVIKRLENL